MEDNLMIYETTEVVEDNNEHEGSGDTLIKVLIGAAGIGLGVAATKVAGKIKEKKASAEEKPKKKLFGKSKKARNEEFLEGEDVVVEVEEVEETDK